MSHKRAYTPANYLTEAELKVLYYILIVIVCGLILKIYGYTPNSHFSIFDVFNDSVFEHHTVSYDLNKVSYDELLYISDIGPATASSIIKYQQETGFSSIEDLLNVQGIGEIKLANLREHFFVVGDSTATEKATQVDATLNRFLRADAIEIQKINGIGEKTAEHIINFRRQNTITQWEDLLQISGIGEKRLETIKEFFTTTAQSNITTGKININTATAEQLITLRGIGNSRAIDIINYRNASGGFKKIEEITLVPGIGTRLYEQIKDFICIGD